MSSTFSSVFSVKSAFNFYLSFALVSPAYFLPTFSLLCCSSPYLSEGCFDIPAVYIVHRHNHLRLTPTTQRCPSGTDPCYYHPQEHSYSGRGGGTVRTTATPVSN